MDGQGMKVGMTPSHPGGFVRTEIVEELGLSVARAAEILGVSRSGLADLLAEKADLSPEMAHRIEKAFGVSMDMLLRMGAWRASHAVRRREDEISVARYRPSGGASARRISA